MRFTSLDQITRSMLLQRGYPIHWYIDFLKYGTDALRELTFDVLKVINSAKLPVNSYKAVTLPCDYVDWVKVGVAAGQYVHPLAQGPINRLNNFDDSGNKIPYSDELPDGTFAEIRGSIEYTNGLNSLGEHTGGIFNHNPGRSIGTFIELTERNEIQLDNDYPYDYIILDYISDGATCSCGCDCGGDSATSIHPYAIAAIEAYIDWKMKAFNRAYGAGEVQMAEDQYIRQERKLRARKNGLTRWDIVQAARLAYSGTYKN
jgi:hypothetical protein